MIEISQLEKSYDNLQVLKNINLSIHEGEIYGLVGRSGAGKSTLLRCINGLERPTKGSVLVNGVTVHNLSEQELRKFRRNIGMIFQQFSLLERRTVYENIYLPLKLWKYDKSFADKRVKELLELVDIADKINSKPRELSGGQKQRVAIARALAMEPQILLCDEATSALDPKTTKSVLALLRKINKELGLTIVVVTHQMSVVRQVCQRISILEDGEMVETGLVEDVFLQQPPALLNLLGDDDAFALPDFGVNIRIMMTGTIAMEPIITDMARSLDLSYPIVSGKMENYRDHMIGSFIINVQPNDLDRVLTYLENRQVSWKYVDSENENILNGRDADK